MTSEFKESHKFEERKAESDRIRAKYKDRAPIIIEQPENTNIPRLDKTKYLVPADLTLGQFMHVVRKRLKLAPEIAIFIFVNNALHPASTTIGFLYNDNKDDDGFMYCQLNGENTFG